MRLIKPYQLQIIGWCSIASTFIIEYYKLVPWDLWDKLLFRVYYYIPFFQFALAPTTILGLILNFVGIIMQIRGVNRWSRL